MTYRLYGIFWENDRCADFAVYDAKELHNVHIDLYETGSVNDIDTPQHPLACVTTLSNGYVNKRWRPRVIMMPTLFSQMAPQGTVALYRCRLTCVEIPMIKIRLSHYRLISVMEYDTWKKYLNFTTYMAESLENHSYFPRRERPPVARDHRIQWSL